MNLKVKCQGPKVEEGAREGAVQRNRTMVLAALVNLIALTTAGEKACLSPQTET